MSILETNDLVKIYQSDAGDIRALDNLQIEVPKGATALLGPNGSGKSTLIKIILGLIKPTSGEYALFGEEGDRRTIERNRIGYMPETPSIVTKVNAVKFVRHFGILSGLSFRQSMQRTHEVLDYVGLGEARYREVNDFSTGMKQRLLFAQSLVHDPDVIILDEPTTGLSPEGRSEMLDLINEIHVDYNKSIIFSTHILPDVENICNYTVLINLGKEVFQGSMEDIENLYDDVLIIEPKNNIERVQEIYDSFGYDTQLKGRMVHISKKDDDLPNLAQINSDLKNEDVQILSIRRQKPNLEDLFLKTIDRDIDQY